MNGASLLLPLRPRAHSHADGAMDVRLSALADLWQPGPPGWIDRAKAEALADGRSPVDIAGASPAEWGLGFPQAALRTIASDVLGDAALSGYRPDPLGNPAARVAVAEWYRRRNTAADPARIVLTPGTSMAYLYALRLLCEPGDELLVPRPGYPLFDDLCRIAGVGVRHYHLRLGTSGHWEFDPEELEFQVTPRTRAVAVVSPHNPTGLHLSAEELVAVGRMCSRRGLALLFDEVFSEFAASTPPARAAVGPQRSLPRPSGADFPLVLTLNGFSKMFSIPQWKLAWMKVDGSDDALVRRFLAAAEHMADTFLPVGELSMAMVPGLMAAGDPAVSGWLAQEFAARRAILRGASPWPVTSWDGGCYACLKAGETAAAEEPALRAAMAAGVLLHPGSWYDMPGHVVAGAVAEPKILGRLGSVPC